MTAETKKDQTQTVRVVGANKWIIEIRHQNDRAYIQAFHKLHGLCGLLGMKQHISVTTGDDAVILESRDNVPITRREMELIFNKAQEKIGMMTVRFYQDPDSPTVSIEVKCAKKEEHAPTPIEAHRRKEHASIRQEAPKECEERAEVCEAPKSMFAQKMEDIETRRKAERSYAESNTIREIEKIKEVARAKKRELKRGKNNREEKFDDLKHKLDKIHDDADSLIRALHTARNLAALYNHTGFDFTRKKEQHVAFAFLVMTMYRLGYEESKDAMSTLIQNV
ncbi:MAG: hypothetical protein M1504_03550, partial [Candidatus Marsarchaeota archaeon]|nr:hypothetical protein [Candidatus Marsarchaeota archaeon]